MEYRGIVPERKLWLKIAMIIGSAFMLYLEIIREYYIYIPLIGFLVLAVFFEKKHIISEQGVDIEYNLLGLKMHNYWRWDEVTTLHADYRKARPKVMLHIGKDIVTRSFVMTAKDCQGALDLARKMNPDIYIRDIN